MLRRAQAIHAHDVGARIEQRLGGFGSGLALRGLIFVLEADGHHHRQAGFLGALDGDQSFAQPGKSFADDEVHALVYLHRELLVECFANAVGGGRAVGLVHPGEAQIARDQALVARDFTRDADGGAVQIFEPVLQADGGQFVAAGIKRQRLQDIGAGFAKLDMQFAQRVWMQQRNFGSERTRAHPSAFFQFQQITAVAQDRTFLEAFENAFFLAMMCSFSLELCRLRLRATRPSLRMTTALLVVFVLELCLDRLACREAAWDKTN